MKISHIAAASLLAISGSAFAEDCADTSWTALAALDCRGAFVGNINGNATEMTYLASQWGAYSPFSYVGTSDSPNSGPFTSDPDGLITGTLTFDSPVTGAFVIGLKAARNYSYYLFDAGTTPLASLTFNTTAGVAVNDQGMPQGTSHAILYGGQDFLVPGPIPEPSTYALMLAGLGAIGLVARRRRAQK